MQPVFSNGSILLTGATGFVGGRLLQGLLQRTRRPIICLIRARDQYDAHHRGWAVTSDSRVRFVCADLARKNLGMDKNTWCALARSVSEIYHCAASVEFDLPLETSRAINVDGTRRLLKLAAAARSVGGFNRFHHVSTAYVAGKLAGRVDANHLPPDDPEYFRNTYERTKACAERLLREQSRVPVTIYRPSIVAGDTKTGETDAWNVLYQPMRMIHRGQLSMLRMGGHGRLDVVGVDYVVNGILTLAEIDAGPFASYHLTSGHRHLDVEQFARISVERCRHYNPQSNATCRIVNPKQWLLLRFAAQTAQRAPSGLAQLRRWGECVARGLQRFSVFEPYTEVETIFDSRSEGRILARAGVRMPAPQDYLRLIADYAIGVDFGSRPTTPVEARAAAS
jgi:long-chain acyl-CoA synthetase